MSNQQKMVPGWIYSLADYRQMFELTDEDLQQRIFEYPGGIASFNAELTAQGGQVVSGDEAYALSATDMQTLATTRLAEKEDYLQTHLDILQHQDADSVAEVIDAWRRAIDLFINDYAAGLEAKRYRAMSLPKLSVRDHEFKLALCSDLFFQPHDARVTQALVMELCRVAEEVRVFPLMTLEGDIATALGPIMLQLQEQNFGVEIRQVAYEQLRGGNAMLRVWARECVVE